MRVLRRSFNFSKIINPGRRSCEGILHPLEQRYGGHHARLDRDDAGTVRSADVGAVGVKRTTPMTPSSMRALHSPLRCRLSAPVASAKRCGGISPSTTAAGPERRPPAACMMTKRSAFEQVGGMTRISRLRIQSILIIASSCESSLCRCTLLSGVVPLRVFVAGSEDTAEKGDSVPEDDRLY